MEIRKSECLFKRSIQKNSNKLIHLQLTHKFVNNFLPAIVKSFQIISNVLEILIDVKCQKDIQWTLFYEVSFLNIEKKVLTASATTKFK